MDRQLHDKFKRYAGKLAGECETCIDGLVGIRGYAMPYVGENTQKPCPTCAPIRKIAESEGVSYTTYPDGRIEYHITYTIPAIVEILKTLGLWGMFRVWHMNQSSVIIFIKATPYIAESHYLHCIANAEILTDPELFKPAVLSFMEGVE